MMKYRAGIFVFFGLLLFITACIKEDRDNCFDDYPYTLSFVYYGDGTTDIFNSRTDNVHLYLFNPDGSYVDHYIRSNQQLNELQGINLDIEPGEYRAVCWANVTAWSEVTGEEENLNNHYLYSRFYLQNIPIIDFDSLYYGSQIITIPEESGGADTIYFQSAHIRLNVYVQGLSSTVDTDTRGVNDPRGWLVLRDVSVGYNFRMQLTNERSDMYPNWTDSNEDDILVSKFNLFRFENENLIMIDIYNGTGRKVYTLGLSDFLARNNINVEGVNEITVPIYIRFVGQYVHISVEGWGSEIVEPIT